MGLFNKKKKRQEEPAPAKRSAPSPSGYVIERRGNYVIVEKNGKEILDGDVVVSDPSGCFHLIEGFKNGNGVLALISNGDLIASKNCEDGIDACAVLGSGVALVATDDEKFLQLSAAGSSCKSIGFRVEPSGSAFYADACAFVCDDGLEVSIKCFNLITGRSWSKSYEREEDLDNFACRIFRDAGAVCIEVDPGKVLRYDLDGKVTA